MKRGRFFTRLLLYLLCACLLTAALTVMLYSVSGARMFSRRLADELMPRAHGIARLASRYQTGQISFESFVDFATKEQPGVQVFIYDSQGQLVACKMNEHALKISGRLTEYVGEVVSTGNDFCSTKWRSSTGVVVGVPVFDNMRRVIGAVFITKPTDEVWLSIRSLIGALLLSCLIASVLMVLPAYFGSRRIIKPIRQMMHVAVSMAGGDFDTRADEDRRDEIGMLGASLNHLSSALRKTFMDLVRSKNELNRILSGLSEGVVAVGTDLAVTYVNPAACRLLGCAEDADCVDAALTPLRTLCRDAAEGGGAHQMQFNANGGILLATAARDERADDASGSVVLLLQDITESERLEQTRREYVANVSHELRTPIASIRSLAETLDDGLVRSEEDRARYYGYILRESLRLSRLIDDLLELSRLQSGSVAFEKTRFSVNDLLCEVADRLRISASYSGITLNCLPPEQPCEAYSNRDRVEQVLVALIDNAIKYAVDEGSVSIEAEPGERIHIRVRNTGHLDDNDLPHLFDRFYKADKSHAQEGTGLGLAITKEIILLLGEEITAGSKDGDVVFSFTLARAD